MLGETKVILIAKLYSIFNDIVATKEGILTHYDLKSSQDKSLWQIKCLRLE